MANQVIAIDPESVGVNELCRGKHLTDPAKSLLAQELAEQHLVKSKPVRILWVYRSAQEVRVPIHVMLKDNQTLVQSPDSLKARRIPHERIIDQTLVQAKLLASQLYNRDSVQLASSLTQNHNGPA